MNTETKYDLLQTLNGVSIITVCAWCHPGNTIFSLRPEVSGHHISHGICRAHLTAMVALMKEAK